MPAASFGFVVVSRIKIDGTEAFDQLDLLASSDVFVQRRSDSFPLGLVPAGSSGFFDESVIQS